MTGVPNDELTAVLKSAAAAAAEGHRPVDVAGIVRGRGGAARRRVVTGRMAFRAAIVAFVVLTSVAVGVAIGTRGPGKGNGGGPGAGGLPELERRYPAPVARALLRLEAGTPGQLAGPGWLPAAGTGVVTPYVAVSPHAGAEAVSSWEVALAGGGDGAASAGTPPAGAPVLARFGATVYRNAPAAYAAGTSASVRPAGPSRTVALGGGVVGYLHTAGAGTHPGTGGGAARLYWVQGGWQLVVAGGAGGATATASALVTYLARHPLPAGPGTLVDVPGRTCATSQVLGTAVVHADLPVAGCSATALARLATSIRVVPAKR